MLKELHRGNALEALAFYQAFTLRPLVEALRMRLSPEHFDFYVRYARVELPVETTARLERLFFVPGVEALAALPAEAEAWFYEVLG